MISPSLCDWAFLVVRAVVGLSALYIGVHLAVAFVRNGLSHRRKRWLIGWQSIFFIGVGVDALMRMRSRTASLFAEEPLNFTTWPYWLSRSPHRHRQRGNAARLDEAAQRPTAKARRKIVSPPALINALASAAVSCPELDTWRRCEVSAARCEACALGGPDRCESAVIKALAWRLAEVTTKKL